MITKEALIDYCKHEAGVHIDSVYPQFKRENILDGARGKGASDKAKFRAFRDAVIERCDQYESRIMASDDPASVRRDYSDIQP